MKRVFDGWNIVIGCTGGFIFVAIVLFGVHSDRIRFDAEQAFEQAQIRMESVIDSADMNQLLAVCNRDAEIHCWQDDYDVAYRGHKYQAQYIAIDYYRLLHGAPNKPYMTAIVHIQRRPQLYRIGTR